MMKAPNAFSQELALWVRDNCTESIVFVELRPRSADRLKASWDQVMPTDSEEEDERLAKCSDYQCCTGTVVNNASVVNNDLTILTCAHVMGPAFKQDHPINAARANDLFEAHIVCDHNEQRYQREAVQNPNADRIYMRAELTEIDATRDLMLLRIEAEVRNCCQQHHPKLHLARTFPSRMRGVVMLSWPPGADRTTVIGEVTHRSRPYKTLSNLNPCEFEMRLSQVNITSEYGSSGAPLLTGTGTYCGVLHGGNGKFSFFVSHTDLRTALRAWGVI